MVTEAEALEYFNSLSHNEQRKFYGKMAALHKSPSYSLGFNLNPKGVQLMAKAVQYCSECAIAYTPKKVSSKRVKFVFEDAATRNRVMLRAMGGTTVQYINRVDIDCTCAIREENGDEE